MSEENATIPTVDEIWQLPRSAQKAFIGRCTRQAQQFIELHRPDAREKLLEAIEQVIRLAEKGDSGSAVYAADLASKYAAIDCSIATSAAAAAACVAVIGVAKHTIRHDFDRLLVLSRRHKWTDATPVPQSVFDDPPSTRLTLSAVAGPEVPEDVIARDLIELYRAVNDYHIARGGGGLSLEDFKRYVAATVPAGV